MGKDGRGSSGGTVEEMGEEVRLKWVGCSVPCSCSLSFDDSFCDDREALLQNHASLKMRRL